MKTRYTLITPARVRAVDALHFRHTGPHAGAPLAEPVGGTAVLEVEAGPVPHFARADELAEGVERPHRAPKVAPESQ